MSAFGCLLPDEVVGFLISALVASDIGLTPAISARTPPALSGRSPSICILR